MKLQAQVIMKLALGLSVGIGAAACQKTGKTTEELQESQKTTETPVQPDWSHHFPAESKPAEPHGIGEPLAKPVAMPVGEAPDFDPCHGCGMG